MKKPLHLLLNLKNSETEHVYALFRVQLFIGIAHSFTNITAFTYFIYRFSIEGLPYAYLAVAGSLLALNIAYEKLEHKFSPLQLLKYIVLFSAGVLLLFWTGFLAINENTLIFMLLVWSVLFYMVTGYAYWGLVSLLFNVRESKRVFSIVGAGDIPAKLIGYLSAPFLIPVIGLNNLLAFALISLGLGFYFVNQLIKKERSGTFKIRHQRKREPVASNTNLLGLKNNFFFKHRLIFFISLLSIVCYNVFNIIDFTFISQIKARYQDISVLASFIAIFFAAGRIGALVLKLIFTSRVIERLGVIACLLITPSVLFLFSLIYLGLNDRSDYSLYFFGIMALVTELLRSTIQEPSFFILFQPLNENTRLKGHIIAKGYMLPPSLLIVGCSLILMRNLHIELNILFTIKILLINLLLWAVIIYFIKKEYIKTLHQSIARGIFSGEDVHIYEKKTIDVLLKKLDSPAEKEIIYALRLLENGGYDQVHALLKQNLFSDKPEVCKYAFTRLEERQELTLPLLQQFLEKEPDEELKGKIIYNLCRLDPQYLNSITDHLSQLPYKVRKDLIVHLLNQSEFNYLFTAGSEINNLIRSGIAAERGLALEIIGELKNIRFTQAIERLIDDPDPAVKRNALIAACKLKHKNLLPHIFHLLSNPANRYLVLQGLFHYGDSLFHDLQVLEPATVNQSRADLIKIAGKVKGPASTGFLLQQLPGGALTEKLVHALWNKGFEAEDVKDIYLLQNLQKEILQHTAEKISFYYCIADLPTAKLLKEAVFSELKSELITVLRLCAMLYHKKEINRTLELIENGDRLRIYNAMEMLELVLPKKISRQIINLVEFVLEPVETAKKSAMLQTEQLFERVVLHGPQQFTSWTRAVCIFALHKNNSINAAQLKLVDCNDQPLLSEVKNHVLNSLQPTAYANH